MHGHPTTNSVWATCSASHYTFGRPEKTCLFRQYVNTNATTYFTYLKTAKSGHSKSHHCAPKQLLRVVRDEYIVAHGTAVSYIRRRGRGRGILNSEFGLNQVRNLNRSGVEAEIR